MNKVRYCSGMPETKDRAHKLIAQSGLMSRRKAETAITEGRVALNGVVFTQMGQLVDPSNDVLTVDGVKVELKLNKQTFLFYKPRGVVTTKHDELGRPTVMDYFKEDLSLNPVGRLDFDSEGLLLMTHDGDLLLNLTHPRYGIKKEYEVDVAGNTPDRMMEHLLDGVELDDGVGVFDEIIDRTEEESKVKFPQMRTYLVTVSEGRNRFIRRMFSAMKLNVTRLKRLRMGEYELGDLKPGEKKEI